MDQTDLDQLLSLGMNEDMITELLRQADRQEKRSDDTRNKEYGTQAGRMYVANPLGAISDMFVRGNAEKKAGELRNQAEREGIRQADRKSGIFNNMQYGTPVAPVKANAPSNIDIGSIDLKNFKAPTVPQVPPPGPSGPMGPPAPSGGLPGAPVQGGQSTTAPAGAPPPQNAAPAASPQDALAMFQKLVEGQGEQNQYFPRF